MSINKNEVILSFDIILLCKEHLLVHLERFAKKDCSHTQYKHYVNIPDESGDFSMVLICSGGIQSCAEADLEFLEKHLEIDFIRTMRIDDCMELNGCCEAVLPNYLEIILPNLV